MCWDDNITNVDKSNHLQSVSLKEARSLFYKHVDNVIFENHEIRTLQSMLSDYKVIVSDYGYDVGDMKSSYLKQLLINEYGTEIGFKERQAKNQSEWVYDAKGGGDYIGSTNSRSGTSRSLLFFSSSNKNSQLSRQIGNIYLQRIYLLVIKKFIFVK